MASALGRPALLPAPSLALKVYLGEFSSDILGSLRVTPSVLTASGFTFEQEHRRGGRAVARRAGLSTVPDGLTAGSATRPPSSAA